MMTANDGSYACISLFTSAPVGGKITYKLTGSRLQYNSGGE